MTNIMQIATHCGKTIFHGSKKKAVLGARLQTYQPSYSNN